MSPVLIWIGIAIVGIFLYMLPALLFRTEGFTNEGDSSKQQQEIPPEIRNIIDSMISSTPSSGSTTTSTTSNSQQLSLPPELKKFASGLEAKLTVKPVETQSSEPASANAATEKSGADAQGVDARKTVSPEPSKVLPFPSVISASAKRGCPVKPPPACPPPPPADCPVPLPPQRCIPKRSSCPPKKPKCPKPKCPPMPDMSEYIRKDSIPCWACKLD
jgi:hypothetical protein